MSSPFPGMNPYLEQGAVRQDFHVMFLAAIKERLAPQVRHKYIVKLEEYVYIHDQPPEPRQLAGRADLAVAASPLMSKEPGAVGVLEAPAQVELVAQDVELARFLEVRDRQGGEPITVLELLSPSNKRPGDGRDRYLAKRGRLSVSGAHLVEIDLLRGGQPMPLWNRPAPRLRCQLLRGLHLQRIARTAARARGRGMGSGARAGGAIRYGQ